MTTERDKDWEGFPVPDREKDGDVIDVWELSPNMHNRNDHDSIVIRDWHKMLAYVEDNLPLLFDDCDAKWLRDHGTSLKFKLVKMTVGEYRGLTENEP